MDACFIQNQVLRAEFVALGGEMRRFQVLGGPDLLWGGDPEVWGRTSPVLFPIVGRLTGDQMRLGDKVFPMGQHGFARDTPFELIRLTREDCTWMLKDNETLRKQFPFPFELRVTHRLVDVSLEVRYELRNPGSTPLPASLGAHPAFRWPIGNAPREGHFIEFEKAETAPVRRLLNGLLDPRSYPSPVEGKVLALKDDLFRRDALVFDQLQSRSLRFCSPAGAALELSWEGFTHLGLWTLPGAGFLCIEPWRGHASPEGFYGDLMVKPGIFRVDPGQARQFSWKVQLIPHA